MVAIVTGGTGFIGGKLVEALVASGYQVRCLVRSTSDTRKLLSLGVELCEGDLGDTEVLKKIPDGGDVLFHLAALVSDWGSKEDFHKYNVKATQTLLEASLRLGLKRFVHMSSSTVIWKSDLWGVHNLVDVDETFPYCEEYNDFYNASKADAERSVLEFYKQKGLETVVVRPSNVWGAGDTVILPRIVKAANKGFLHPMGSSSRTVTPCLVENLVQALLLCSISKNAPGNIYFINDGVKISYMDFIKKQLHASGIEWSPGFSIPYRLAYTVAAVLELIYKTLNVNHPPVLTRMAVAVLAGSRSYSIEKAKKELGYAPDIDMGKGMEKLGDWVRNIGGTKALLNLLQ